MIRLEEPELSVVIPALNEARALPELLRELAKQEGVELEVIVADGGSTDDTASRAMSAGAHVVAARRGRGAQMNAGAAKARGAHLLFLHADSVLSSPRLLRDARAALRAAEADDVRDTPRVAQVAGHFPLRFAREREGHGMLFRILEEKTSTNRRYTINGDQGVLISRAYFDDLGGFDEALPFLEDQRLAARIFDGGRWIVLPGHLVTAARRFESQGHHRLLTLMAVIMGMHAARVEPFFARAPKVYAAQGDAAKLDVRPYLRLVRDILIEAGPAGAARIAFYCGRFVRQQSWQPFFWLDIAARPWLGPGRYPALRFHDAVVHPLTSHVVMDALVGVAVPIWFLLILPAGYGIAAWLRRRG
jgi:rSAM/selenodomain-associated transferase 2